MTALVPIALLGWIPLTVVLFACLRPHIALIVSYAAAWMFLPMATLPVLWIPDLSKVTSASYGVLMGAFLFHGSAVLSWRPKLVDAPMVVWCLCGLFSSLSNGLGAWDGLSAVFSRTMLWGVPYLMGRVFLSNRAALRDCALGVLIGGLVYVPFCLYEIRMWQPLHQHVYGFMQDSWNHVIRFGGFRPIVFMQTGLMVALWMCNAAMIALWLWRTGSLKRLLGIPASILAIVQLVVAVFCRSTGAIVLMLGGIGALFSAKRLNSRLPLIALLAIPIIYISARGIGLFSVTSVLDTAVEQVAASVGERPASSLAGRLHKEVYYAEHAWRRPVFGWGGYDRMRPSPEEAGEPVRGVDALWTVAFGQNGLVGLISVTLAVLLPCALLLRQFRPSDLFAPALAPATVLAIVLGAYMIDNLFNGMVNPTYTLSIGGITGLCVNSSKPFWFHDAPGLHRAS